MCQSNLALRRMKRPTKFLSSRLQYIPHLLKLGASADGEKVIRCVQVGISQLAEVYVNAITYATIAQRGTMSSRSCEEWNFVCARNSDLSPCSAH